MTTADGFLAQGKISKTNHDALVAAIAALKAILTAINEKELLAQEVVDRGKAVRQQLQDRITSLLAPPPR